MLKGLFGLIFNHFLVNVHNCHISSKRYVTTILVSSFHSVFYSSCIFHFINRNQVLLYLCVFVIFLCFILFPHEGIQSSITEKEGFLIPSQRKYPIPKVTKGEIPIDFMA
jgi:hypothetical protein